MINQDPYMRPHVDCRLPITRRSFLQAIGLAFARRLRPLAAGFTAIADELARLFRICSLDTALQGA